MSFCEVELLFPHLFGEFYARAVKTEEIRKFSCLCLQVLNVVRCCCVSNLSRAGVFEAVLLGFSGGENRGEGWR